MLTFYAFTDGSLGRHIKHLALPPPPHCHHHHRHKHAGKSTFSRSLQDASTVSWVHVNQDAINKGKPGKREQCVAALRAALAEGSCCIIDRCHLDASQRATFLELAAECHVAAHCVALAIPAQACAGRVAARTDHPGGVQGDNNRAVVFRMAKQQDSKGWPPTAAEGFTSVMDCFTDSDANAAVRAWAAYGAAAAAGGSGAAAALTTATAVGGSSEGAKPVGAAQGVARATLGGADVDKRFKLDSPWAQALRKAAQDPEGSQQQVLHKDEEQVVMIMDAFPKARSHALVIARDPALRSIADLRAEHLPLLEHMRQVALDWIAKRKEQDFDSPALKNKKHWNTFTTEFFRPLDLVLRELEGHGKLTLISEAEEKRFEGQELRCHACGLAQKSIPALKSHIVACDAVKCLPGL
eukprot:XP_001691304.1 predicted protein [Chlamydomonas reinhardtii]